jgi:hypothetical protein
MLATELPPAPINDPNQQAGMPGAEAMPGAAPAAADPGEISDETLEAMFNATPAGYEPSMPVHADVAAGAEAGLSESDLDSMNAIANGVDVRAEDAGRVHDIDAAHEMAQQENVMFDLHTEAIEEDKQRTQAKLNEEAAKAEEEKQRLAAEEEAAQTAKAEAQPAAALNPAETTATAAAEGDIRAQAEVALQAAGAPVEMTPQTKVTKDALNNTLVVQNGSHIQLLTPNLAGKYDVSDYRFEGGVLSVGGNAFMPAEKFVEGQVPAAPAQGEITVPPAVANIVGFDRAVPAAQQAAQAPAPQTPQAA